MRKAIILDRLVLTTVYQSTGAPIIDLCGGRTLEERTWKGYAIHLSPWRRNRYGDRAGGLAFCIGIMRGEK